jgi:hypothetical protein
MRATPRAVAHRTFINFGRVMFKGAYEDKYMMQQFEGSAFKGEGQKHIERPQNYGFRSVPLPPDDNGGPTGYVFSHGGNPSHRIVGAVEDDRHTPYKMPAGSSFQYNHGGEGTYIDNEKGSFMMAGGYNEKADQARSSIRHVTKQKQPRQYQPLPKHGAGGGQQQGQQGQQYKHQGDDPSGEVFVEKDRAFSRGAKSALMEINSGKQWTISDDQHSGIIAKSKENVIWVDQTNCYSTKPIQVKDYPYSKPSPSSSG